MQRARGGFKEMSHFDITSHGHIIDAPEIINESSAWIEHIPFAFFLISILRPKSFVELGVYAGDSYNAFCQAVKVLNTETICYGVDIWKGDEHAGFYEEVVYKQLVDHQNKKNYTQFSNLLRKSFNEALAQFSESSIDLLHIDGLHTYEAVKNDFESWLPKMSERGVILFHDTVVRERNFGVWKLWEEISAKYPSFEFKHGYGLGVLVVGNKVVPEFLDFLEQAKKNRFYQNLFYKLGVSILHHTKYQQYQNLIESREFAIAMKLKNHPFMVKIIFAVYGILIKIGNFLSAGSK